MAFRASAAQFVKEFLEKRARAKLEQDKEVARLLALPTYSTGSQYTDYWLLYSYIKKHKPREVLELGPGVTTLIMAQALKENGFGRITAMEDVPQYHKLFIESIPPALSQFVDPQLSPATEQRFGPFTGLGYSNIPDREYDFVWVDGPKYDANTQFNFDLITLIQKSEKPVTAFIDSRTGTCFIYWLLLGKKFSFDYLLRTGRVQNATRKDIKDFDRVVRRFMGKRTFRRWLSWLA